MTKVRADASDFLRCLRARANAIGRPHIFGFSPAALCINLTSALASVRLAVSARASANAATLSLAGLVLFSAIRPPYASGRSYHELRAGDSRRRLESRSRTFSTWNGTGVSPRAMHNTDRHPLWSYCSDLATASISLARARMRMSSVRLRQRTVPVGSIKNSAGRAMSEPSGPPPVCSR